MRDIVEWAGGVTSAKVKSASNVAGVIGAALVGLPMVSELLMAPTQGDVAALLSAAFALAGVDLPGSVQALLATLLTFLLAKYGTRLAGWMQGEPVENIARREAR